MEENLEKEEKHIDENGEIVVQVSTIGQIDGSDIEGNPIPQNITQDSLDTIAQDLNAKGEEVLVDADHQSAKAGLDRNTRAMGWLSRFWANAKGLFAKMKLTPKGKEVVEGREYRKLSPVFTLDKDGKPTSLVSVAMTNQPAMTGIEPILNQKPKEGILENMTKEELVEIVKATVAEQLALNQAPKPEEQEKPEEQTPAGTETSSEETPKSEEPKEEKEEKEETAENACGTEDKEDAATNESAEEKSEEKTEDKKPEEKKPEVISEAALNMAATSTSKKVDWHGLHGNDFFAWLAQNKQSI